MGTISFSAMNVIANADTWMEDSAIQQLQRTSELPGMVSVAGMPDLHPGRGYPVGAAFLSKNVFYPALVGNDIGCGMNLYQTDLATHQWSGSKLASKLGSIDDPLDDSWGDELMQLGMSDHPYASSLGSIGGGNHFAEMLRFDAWGMDRDRAEQLAPWLNHRRLVLLVHSGSRGLGESILRRHVDQFGHAGLEHGSLDAESYFDQHDKALAFANANRHLIGLRMLRKWRADYTLGLSVHHNYVEKRTIEDQTFYLHRKGATPSDQGLVMIPGSRGHASYLVSPKPSASSLWTLAHGAGRKWMRSDCMGKLGNKVRFTDLLKTSLGSTVVCNNKDLAFEEVPQAYKDIETVIQSLVDHDLIDVVARYIPVMTYKTSGGCGC